MSDSAAPSLDQERHAELTNNQLNLDCRVAHMLAVAETVFGKFSARGTEKFKREILKALNDEAAR